MEDCLVITFDYAPSTDIPHLLVSRREGERIRFLNSITGDEAVELYNKLRGIEAYAKYNPKGECR